MPKPKRGPALFDLLSKDATRSAEALKVPDWWRSRRRPTNDCGAAPTYVGKSMDGVPASESLSSPPTDNLRRDFIEFDNDRIRVSFTSLTAAVAVFAGLVLLLGVYESGHWMGDSAGVKRGHVAGRMSYAADAADEIAAARVLPPAPNLIQSLLDEPDLQADRNVQPVPTDERTNAIQDRVEQDDAIESRVGPQDPDDQMELGERILPEADTSSEEGEPPARSPWIRDYTYVVAQGFPVGHGDDAGRAQEFLSQHGVATRRVSYPSGAIHLITAQGYNRNDSTQRRMADALLNRVRAIGVRYFNAGGGYKLEGYFKTLKGETW